MKNIIKFYMLFFCLQSFIVVNLSFSEGIWHCYTNSNYVRSLAVQGDYIWCATLGGVVRWNKYDSSYIVYTRNDRLLSNWVGEIYIEENGLIWTGTLSSNNISIFDGTTWESTINEEIPVPIKPSSMIVDSDGLVWVGSIYGVVHYNGNDWILYTSYDGLIDNNIVDCAIDDKGTKWFGTKNGVSGFDGEVWSNYTTEHGLIYNEITSIAVDLENVKWFCTRKGVSSFNGTEWKSYSWEEGVPGSINDMAVDNNNIKWFATINGLARFDGSTWKTFIPEHKDLAGDDLEKIVIDSDGILWLCSYQTGLRGLIRFDGSEWSTFRTDGPGFRTIRCAVVDKNNIKWFATCFGVSRFDGTTWTIYDKDYGMASDGSQLIIVDKNNTKWVNNGTTINENEILIRTPENTPSQFLNMHAYDVDSQGTEWVLTPSGVSSFDGTNWKDYAPEDWDWMDNRYYSLEIDRDDVLWIETTSGVVSFDGTTWVRYNEATGFTDFVSSITVDSENVKWFGCMDGLRSFNGDEWKHYTTKTKNSGLHDDNVWLVRADKSNTIWIASGMVARLQSFDGQEWKTYDKVGAVEDIAVEQNNTLWFATYENGVWSYSESSSSHIGEINTAPEWLIIHGNYPNPFNHTTTIGFVLPHEEIVHLTIYNIMGQKVRTLLSETKIAGTYSIIWDGKDAKGNIVSSGIYLTHLNAGLNSISRRMLFLK